MLSFKNKKQLVIISLISLILLAVTWHYLGFKISCFFGKIWSIADVFADNHPLVFMMLAIGLTLIGMPLSFFYIVTTAFYGIPKAMVVNAIVIGFQLITMYWASKTLLEKPLHRWLQKKGHEAKIIPNNIQTQTTLLMRLIPGIPVGIQNLVLALGGVPFKKYFWISWPIICLWMAGIVLSSGSFLEGNWTLGFAGVALVVALTIVNRLFKRRRRQKSGTQP